VSWDLCFRRGGGRLPGSGGGVGRGGNVAFEIGGKTSTGPGSPRMLAAGTCSGTLMTGAWNRGVIQAESDVDIDRPISDGWGDLEMERILTTRVAELEEQISCDLKRVLRSQYAS